MKKERLLYFDGLRGLAALIVLTTHISLLFFENVVYKEDIYSIFDKVYVRTPINIISQGNMAVRYFFHFIRFFNHEKNLWRDKTI